MSRRGDRAPPWATVCVGRASSSTSNKLPASWRSHRKAITACVSPLTEPSTIGIMVEAIVTGIHRAGMRLYEAARRRLPSVVGRTRHSSCRAVTRTTNVRLSKSSTVCRRMGSAWWKWSASEAAARMGSLCPGYGTAPPNKKAGQCPAFRFPMPFCGVFSRSGDDWSFYFPDYYCVRATL